MEARDYVCLMSYEDLISACAALFFLALSCVVILK